LKKNSDIAAVQPKILNYNKKEEFEYAGAAGGFIDLLGYTCCRGRLFYKVEHDRSQYNNNLEIFWASGACMAIRAQDFNLVNGFDFDFFAHMEEIDLCWRLKNQGKKIMFCHESKVYHVGGGTLNYNSPRKIYLNYRNNLLMIHKNYLGKSPLWLIIFLRIILDQISGVRFIFEGKFKNILEIQRAHLHYFCQIKKAQKKRKNIKKSTLNLMEGVLRTLFIWEFFFKKKIFYSEIKKN